MAKFKSDDLLEELKEDVRRIEETAQFFQGVDRTKMVYVPAKGQWSIVQILEHLNAYGRYYLPAIEKAMSEKVTGKEAWFNSGFWGEYFTKSMKPTNVYEVKNKMKALKSYSFPNSLNVETVVTELIEQQRKMVKLLDAARHVNLNEVRVPITVTKLVKLRLGDTFRFLVAHEQRHMIQARNTLKKLGVTTDRFPVILQAVAQ